MKILSLVTRDLRLVRRDGMLLVMALVTPLLAAGIRYGWSELQALVMEFAHLDITAYHPVVLVFILSLEPLLLSYCTALIMVEEDDERIIAYLMITPLTPLYYLFFRLVTWIMVTFFFSLAAMVIIGIPVTGASAFSAALMFSLETAIGALVIAGIAANRVEAMAVAKVYGFTVIGSFAPVMFTEPWSWVASVLPQFWPAVILLSGEIKWYVLLGGVTVHGLWIVLLYRYYRNRPLRNT